VEILAMADRKTEVQLALTGQKRRRRWLRELYGFVAEKTRSINGPNTDPTTSTLALL